MIATGSVLIQACLDLARYIHVSEVNYRRVPGFHTSIAVLALGALLQASPINSTDLAAGRLSAEEITAICQDVSLVHPVLATIIARLQKPLPVTQAMSEFVEDGRKRQQAGHQNHAEQDLYNTFGMPPIADGIDMFTDWIWPADEDWLSGLLSLDPQATTGVLGASLDHQ